MEFLTDPNNYDACLSISALVLMVVIIIIHSSEEFSSRYVRGENGQGKRIPAIRDVKTGKKTTKKQKNTKTRERDGLKKTL